MDSDIYTYGCAEGDCDTYTMDLTETLSASIPQRFLPVFDAVTIQDFDTPFPRAGAALRFLAEHGFIRQYCGDVLPVKMTELGRALAKERGIVPGI